MYEAKVYNIMIAAPADIKDEIEITKKVLYEWNTIYSDKEKIVLMPKHWADSTYPEIGIRPQTAINKQIVEDSDLLISIFGAKLGTPTGESQSGSIEEIEEHKKAGKNVMVFFKKSGSFDDVDPEQLKRLQEYKKKNKDNLFWTEYDNPGEFKGILYQKLQLFLNKNWLKADSEVILSDEEVLRETDRRISSLHSLMFQCRYVDAQNMLFDSLSKLLECDNKKRAKHTIELVLKEILGIFHISSSEGKCRVTQGRRHYYIELINRAGGEVSEEIIQYLENAEEVSEDFNEFEEIFQ